jgi:Protein of unknown function (DUF3311)
MIQKSRKRFWYWLLLMPCVAVVCVPMFNKLEPAWHGIPFFYWYQLLWIPLSAAVIGVVYIATRERGPGNAR